MVLNSQTLENICLVRFCEAFLFCDIRRILSFDFHIKFLRYSFLYLFFFSLRRKCHFFKLFTSRLFSFRRVGLLHHYNVSVSFLKSPTTLQFEKLRSCLSSSSATTSLKGMHDYYGTGIHTHQHIINVATQVAKNYGCTEISTPILESTHLFQRGLGESSEVIVGKELYSFTDSKGEREVALRPEGTAGVMRALAQHELQRETHRLYYSGPFFRRERPQKGRYRQFHQFGVEQFGFQDTFSEVDMISMGNMLLEKLKVASKLKIHTIGNVQERSAFVKELHSFLLSQKEQLSLLSQSRLDTNPLRILDSKLPQDINALNKAPLLIDFLGQESRTHFEAIQSGLKSLNIPYEIDHKLVRGLDYYQHTVWEFVSNHPALGNSQSTVLAGGRYDGLLEKIGCLKSSSKPAMGWACGIERLALVASVSPRITKSVLMVSLSTPPNQNDQSSEQNPHQKAHQLAYSLRLKNIPTVHHPLDSLSKRLPGLLKASSTGTTPTHLVVIGTSELETGYLKVKCLFTRSESSVSIEELASYLQSQLQQD